jgi:hypothetical protein
VEIKSANSFAFGIQVVCMCVVVCGCVCVWARPIQRFTIPWLRLLSNIWMVAVRPTLPGLCRRFPSRPVDVQSLAKCQRLLTNGRTPCNKKHFTPPSGLAIGWFRVLNYWLTSLHNFVLCSWTPHVLVASQGFPAQCFSPSNYCPFIISSLLTRPRSPRTEITRISRH